MSHKKTTEIFIKQAKDVHGDAYDYSQTIYNCAIEKVVIKCRKHGDFNMLPNNHLNGKGCPKCAILKRPQCQKDTRNDFVRKANLKHCNSYDYSMVKYTDSQTKVDIICNKHGIFKQTPASHISGRGCPKCGEKRGIKISKEEKTVYNELCTFYGKNNVIKQYLDSRYPFYCDMYIVPLDTFVEYNAYFTHGGHWYNESNPDDLTTLECWKAKAENSVAYKDAIDTWTKRDPRKRGYAKRNDLFYVVLWNMNDFVKWKKDGFIPRKDW